jgi:hypothetical protein
MSTKMFRPLLILLFVPLLRTIFHLWRICLKWIDLFYRFCVIVCHDFSFNKSVIFFYKKKILLFCTDEIPVIKSLKCLVKRYELVYWKLILAGDFHWGEDHKVKRVGEEQQKKVSNFIEYLSYVKDYFSFLFGSCCRSIDVELY